MEPAVTRRELLRRSALIGAAGAAVVADAGCTELRTQANRITGPSPAVFTELPSEALLANGVLHAARRIGFGPRPGDLSYITKIGAQQWIEEQLGGQQSWKTVKNPEAIGDLEWAKEQLANSSKSARIEDDDPAVNWRVNGLDTQQTERDSPDALFSMDYDQLLHETQQAAILRAVYSRYQLRENMADFWTNHFNIYAPKSDGQAMVPVDTESVIREHIWSFPDMLMASARSPAMLNYLDNKLNHRGVANENYARELLELHTLGVKSGYTLKDIQEVARCLTGWTIKTGFQRGQFEYVESLHDNGRKHIPFLNLTLEPDGNERDAETVIHTLATHPVVGRFLAGKLCRRFLGTAPPDVIEKSANAFVTSKGDVRAMLRPILLDALFKPDANQPILKRPLDLMVSALRSLGADTDGGEALQNHLANMGQPLYEWPMPDGFPEKPSAWSGSMLPRWNFALALASNAIDGTRVDLKAPLIAAKASTDDSKLDAMVKTVLCAHVESPQVKQTAAQIRQHIANARSKAVSEEQVIAECNGLLLASPAFQWK